jgi:hypothetical protein
MVLDLEDMEIAAHQASRKEAGAKPGPHKIQRTLILRSAVGHLGADILLRQEFSECLTVFAMPACDEGQIVQHG